MPWSRGPRFAMTVRGADAVDLLHRVTSNDVRGLAVGAVNHQCLLTAKGKITSIFDLERLADGAVLRGPIELKDVTRAAIERYIILEDARIEMGDDLPGAGDEDEARRIRSGEVRWGRDIDGETIPFEAGLDAWVSTSKGCYTGQETIARIETYGQVARNVRRLTSEAARQPSPCALSLEGSEMGRVTSVTPERDAAGLWHGLGMIRRAAQSTGSKLVGADGSAWTVLE